MKLALGADHGGASQKESLFAQLTSQGYEVVDFGAGCADGAVDYPDYALAVARAVAAGEADFGILICGTGIGMAMAANKVAGIRAATVTDVTTAYLARQHNNANILCLSGRFTPPDINLEIVDAFLGAQFEGGRHQRRLDKIAEAENQRNHGKQE
ncbi:MAG: ribose 5-phosphate isomerase B [Actinomycetia bacterium]|nr:ribose 5-phosphate isomerase B [Actinomycetes bacterium]